jgi:hypothetical protein
LACTFGSCSVRPVFLVAFGHLSWWWARCVNPRGLTIQSSRRGFATRLISGVRHHNAKSIGTHQLAHSGVHRCHRAVDRCLVSFHAGRFCERCRPATCVVCRWRSAHLRLKDSTLLVGPLGLVRCGRASHLGTRRILLRVCSARNWSIGISRVCGRSPLACRVWCLTIQSSRRGFATRLISGVRRLPSPRVNDNAWQD